MQIYALPTTTIAPEAIAFSPDGRWLAVTEHGRVFVVDTVGNAARTIWPDQDTGESPLYACGIGFTSDSRGVIVPHFPALGSSRTSSIEVHDVETGAVQRAFEPGYGVDFEVGPGGRLVYVVAWVRARWGVEFVRWNPLTGEQLPAFAGRSHFNVGRVAISPDEKWLAGYSGGEGIGLWNLGGKKLPSRATRRLHIESAHVPALAISSDGAYVAAGSYLSTGGTVHICDARKGEWIEVCARERDTCRDLAFHPSCPVLAHRGGPGEVAFYDAATRTELKRFVWPVENIKVLAFSPDGLRCAAAGTSKVVVWDVDV